jgi:hypothetical protein
MLSPAHGTAGTRRGLRHVVTSATVVAVAGLLGIGVLPVAAADTTPPTGSAEIWSYDLHAGIADLRLTFADADSGIATVLVSCDDGAPFDYAMASHIFVPWLDPTKGGCDSHGAHTLWVEARNGDGLAKTVAVNVLIEFTVSLSISDNATTGEPFTITPTYEDGFVMPADAECMWEFRWGDTASLNQNDYDSTFGSLLLSGTPAKGFCGPWTFTLPWVPVRQYQVSFHLQGTNADGDVVVADTWGFPDDGRGFITADVGSTGRRITSSNLPLVFLLPDAYVMTVGEPITYRVYPVGNISIYGDDSWVAGWEDSEHAIVKAGGSSFTFTPDRAGDWSVFWNGGPHHAHPVGAGYDPPARYPDNTAPNTTAPVQAIGSAGPGASIPATITWSGSDSGGWGIDHYNFQYSKDGGSWAGMVKTSSKNRSVLLEPNHRYRYRVRAVDRAGNTGSWDYGPTFLAYASQETSSYAKYTGTWTAVTGADLWKGGARTADAAGATATYTISARSIAWISERGPTMGSAKVYVDGVLVRTLSLSASTPSSRVVVWRRTWSSKATHAIRIVVVGTAGHPTVSVDGFVALR